MTFKTIIPVLLCFFVAGALSAQSMATTTDIKSFTAKGATETELTDENWSIFKDDENQVYYIDFESLSVNLSNVVVKDASGEVLLNDDVFDLPVNTIYELDMSQYQQGEYQLELRSFTGIIRKKVAVE